MGITKENCRPQQPNALFSPVGLYNFGVGTQTIDSSGNGRDLSASGTILNCGGLRTGTSSITPTAASAYLSSSDTAFNISGSLTVALTVYLGGNQSLNTNKFFAGYGGTGATAAENIQWSVFTRNTLGKYYPGFLFETGSGVATTVQFTSDVNLYVWTHVAISRTSSGTIKLYLNGALAESIVSTLPTGGGTGLFVVGNTPTLNTGSVSHYLNSLAVYDSELTSNQIRYLARKILAL